MVAKTVIIKYTPRINKQYFPVIAIAAKGTEREQDMGYTQ